MLGQATPCAFNAANVPLKTIAQKLGIGVNVTAALGASIGRRVRRMEVIEPKVSRDLGAACAVRRLRRRADASRAPLQSCQLPSPRAGRAQRAGPLRSDTGGKLVTTSESSK